MKANNKTILLVCLVVAIWGYAALSFFGNFSGTSYNYSLTNKNVNVSSADYKIDDSFVLLASYRDPFLTDAPRFEINRKNIPSGNIKMANLKEEEKKKEKNAGKPVDIGSVVFHGIVSNPSTKKKIALVSLNNKQYMVSEGENIEGVSFIKNNKDSVLITYEKKAFYIKRK